MNQRIFNIQYSRILWSSMELLLSTGRKRADNRKRRRVKETVVKDHSADTLSWAETWVVWGRNLFMKTERTDYRRNKCEKGIWGYVRYVYYELVDFQAKMTKSSLSLKFRNTRQLQCKQGLSFYIWWYWLGSNCRKIFE